MGFVGKTFHAPLIRSIDGLKLAVVSSRDEEKVKARHSRCDRHRLTRRGDPASGYRSRGDCLPNATHAPLAKLALNAGKHVVVDKPFTLDMQEARELIALAQEKQLLLSVFHNRRWDSDFLGIKQVIEQGLIGNVKHFESHFDRFRPEVRVRWREQNVPGSGLWFDLGPHLIDQALQLFGLPQSVQGNIATLRQGAEINDWAHVVLNTPSTRSFCTAACWSPAAARALPFTVTRAARSNKKPTSRRASCWRASCPAAQAGARMTIA
ncbi:Uncharacterized oxidoreductase ydgJ [Raoultella terrigena]|uniref:Uncharacterized oxidoreductase ydgJ n=1 Tax=Raoultella terrigena TaxID=577 RepID=A0A4U9CT62_RAOTE|nr:Uncharacterized oxidoreductase ydgJ [Raoultella terrigena]